MKTHKYSSILFLILIIFALPTPSIGLQMGTFVECMDYFGGYKTETGTVTDSTGNSHSETGFTSHAEADALNDGNLALSAKAPDGFEFVWAHSQAWYSDTLSNSSDIEQYFNMKLSYDIFLNPVFSTGYTQGNPTAKATITVLVDGNPFWSVNYFREAYYDYNLNKVVYAGLQSAALSEEILLGIGTIAAHDSIEVTYLMDLWAEGPDEWHSVNANGNLHDDLTAASAPEPSTCLLLAAGIACFAFYKSGRRFLPCFRRDRLA